MALAVPEIAEAAEGAGAAEGGMSSEASQAVAAARAGHGRRLTPEVSAELRRRASRKAKVTKSTAKSTPAPSSGGGGGPSVVGRVGGAAVRTGGRAISGNFGMAGRVIIAFGAFLLALELASYLSGRYFTYSLSKGGQKLAGAAQHIDLYPGQSHELGLRKALPS